MSPSSRRAVLFTCGAGALLGLAGCFPAASAPADPAAEAASATSSPIPGKEAGTDRLPNGSRLNAMLLTADTIPKTLRLNPAGVRTTGNGFNPPMSASAVPVEEACKTFGGTAWSSAAGYNAASFAQNDYMDDAQNMFAQELETYRGDEARAVMAKLRAALAACRTHVFEQDGVKFDVTLTVTELPGVGDEAVQVVRTSPTWTGGSTLVAARVGSVLVTTHYNDQKNTGAAGVELTKALVKNVVAGR